jgi:1,4-alpha-glucan branching enzyme
MWAHPGKQLLFMGCEFGQESEWSEKGELDWWLLDHSDHQGLQDLVRDLNRVYKDNPAFWATDHDAEKFSWIDANDAGNNVFSFVRYGPDDSGGRSAVACIANFSAIPHHGYRLGLPYAGRWEEVVNTDATSYGGSGVGNFGAVEANGTPWHGLESSAELSVPPLATVYLRFTG